MLQKSDDQINTLIQNITFNSMNVRLNGKVVGAISRHEEYIYAFVKHGPDVLMEIFSISDSQPQTMTQMSNRVRAARKEARTWVLHTAMNMNMTEH